MNLYLRRMESHVSNLRRLCFLLILFAVFTGRTYTANKTINIAFMAPSKSTVDCNVSSSVGGFVVGLESVINETNLLDDFYLNVTWYDSLCTSKTGLGKAADAHVLDGVDVYIGPPCSVAMHGVGQLASYWNLPVLGWLSTDQELGDKVMYTTLVRTFPPANKFGRLCAEIFEFYSWRVAALITERSDTGSYIGQSVTNYFQKSNISVSEHFRVNRDESVDNIRNVFTQLALRARIVVMYISVYEIRKYMLVAYDLGMTRGQFVYWSLEYLPNELWRFGNESWMGDDGRDAEARQAMNSVFHIVQADSQDYYFDGSRGMEFRLFAYERASSPPWNQFLPAPTMSDRYSPFLADTVYLYALLVNETVADGGDYTNGTYIFERSKYKIFNGTTGTVFIDPNGDREPNFWILDMEENGFFTVMVMVVWAVVNGSSHPEQVFVRVRPPRWPDGRTGHENAPPDVPECGFDGLLCPAEVSEAGIIAGVISGVVLVTIVIAGLFYYRKRHFEEMLDRMLWRVTFEDIDFNVRGKRFGSHGQMSMNSSGTFPGDRALSLKSVQSTRTNVSTTGQIFTQAALYKGSIVAVRKVNKESVKVTRELQLEMSRMKEMSHNNINTFIGACVGPTNVCVLWQYCSKGSLQDVLWDEAIKLDEFFKLSIIVDILKGMTYLHQSSLSSHGRLKSTNILIDSRWSCKITDYGLSHFMGGEAEDADKGDFAINSELYWTAPELLRTTDRPRQGTKKGDVYSFAIICKEILCRTGPYTESEDLQPQDIIQKVKLPLPDKFFRPQLSALGEMDSGRQKALVEIMEISWAEDPQIRPSFAQILKMVLKCAKGMPTNILDNMIKMMEKYANNLEELVADRTEQLEEEKKKTDKLLYRMLPASVADSLKQGTPVDAEWFDDVTIYFSDIKGFTNIAAVSTPMQVVAMLNKLYTVFDDVITKHDVYKVETIGDAYMIVSGLPKPNGHRHVSELANCALDILSTVVDFQIPHLPDHDLKIRIGVHSGPCAAGVVGLAMPRYCLFGDTVNTASRMESNGEAMRIHISNKTHDALRPFKIYRMKPRGVIEVKGKGHMKTYWLTGKEGYTKPLPRESVVMDTSTYDADGNTTMGNILREIQEQHRKAGTDIVGSQTSFDKSHTFSADTGGSTASVATQDGENNTWSANELTSQRRTQERLSSHVEFKNTDTGNVFLANGNVAPVTPDVFIESSR